MRSSMNIFNSILEDTLNSRDLYNYIDSVLKPPYDYSDLLRWQWAQSVSALDKLIHDLVRVGMIEAYTGRRLKTFKFMQFQISLDTHIQAGSDLNQACYILENQIVHKHSFLSFQEPGKIADALSNIWDEQHKWKKIAESLNMRESYVKTKLNNISTRRNQIVHEGDYSSSLLQRDLITLSDTDDVVNFIKLLGEHIYNLVKIN